LASGERFSPGSAPGRSTSFLLLRCRWLATPESESSEVSIGSIHLQEPEGVVANFKSPQNQGWHTRIVKMSVDGKGALAICTATGRGRPMIRQSREDAMPCGAIERLKDSLRCNAFTATSYFTRLETKPHVEYIDEQ